MLIHGPEIGCFDRQHTGIVGHAELAAAFERAGITARYGRFVRTEVDVVLHGSLAPRPGQIGLHVNPLVPVARRGSIRGGWRSRETPHVTGAYRVVGLDLIDAPEVLGARQERDLCDIVYRHEQATAHQVGLGEVGRRAEVDVMEQAKAAGRPHQQWRGHARGPVNRRGVRGLESHVFRHAHDILYIGLAPGVTEADEPAKIVIRHVVLDPSRGISTIIPGQDRDVGGDARSQGPLRGPRLGQAPGNAGGSESSRVPAVPGGAGGVETQHGGRAAVTPGIHDAGCVSPIIERNVGIPHDLAAGVEVLAQRAGGGLRLHHRVRHDVATEHHHTVLLVGDASRHPRLELVGIENLVAGRLQGVPRGFATSGPGRGIATIIVGGANPLEIGGLGPHRAQYHCQKGQTHQFLAHVRPPSEE